MIWLLVMGPVFEPEVEVDDLVDMVAELSGTKVWFDLLELCQ
jgi:hypothetical protein